MQELTMTSMQRMIIALSHKEPDRVPFLLPTYLHGAKLLGLSIKEYFSNVDYIVEGMLRLHDRYRPDAYFGFLYAPIEIEAWGGEVIFVEDGPPNSGRPIIKDIQEIMSLEPPKIADSPSLQKVLQVISRLKEHAGDETPVLGIVVSPFSLPVMQMGFESYLKLIYRSPQIFERLMQINEEFCVNWANAQLAAGATAIVYFDPVSTTTIIPRELYLTTGYKVAKSTISKINSPVVTAMASGRCIPILNDVIDTGTVGVSVSTIEDLTEIKSICREKITVLGNLNAIEMRNWSSDDVEYNVKKAIAAAGRGGGFILLDNHGEIPWQVSDETLMAISNAVNKWGKYPLDWVE